MNVRTQNPASTERDQTTAALYKLNRTGLTKLADALNVSYSHTDSREALIKRLLKKAGYTQANTPTLKPLVAPQAKTTTIEDTVTLVELEIALLKTTIEMLQHFIAQASTHRSASKLAREARHELLAFHGHSNIGRISAILTKESTNE